MLLMAESTGNTLSGAVDGTNQLFVPSRPMRLDLPVSVYVNGMLRISQVANGYDLLSPTQVRMREAPMMGEEIAVSYLADPPPVAVAAPEMPEVNIRLLGTPLAPAASALVPVSPQAVLLP